MNLKKLIYFKINYLTFKIDGYSLLEVMTALILLGIFSTLAVPSCQDMLKNHHELVLRSTILRTVEIARQEAQIRKKSVSICKSKNHFECGGEWNEGLLIFVDEQEDGKIRKKEDIILVEQISPHGGKIVWRAYPFYRDHLQFKPVSLSLADNGMFWYCREQQHLPVFAIAISKSGSARVIYPNEDGLIKDSRGRNLYC